MRLLVLCLGAVGLLACEPEPMPYADWVGRTLQDTPFVDMAGQAQTVAGLGPQPIVLNIWATWCPPCIKELPSLAALAKSKDYHVVAVATDRDSAVIQKYLTKQPWAHGEMVIWHDPLARTIRKELGSFPLPTTLVVDATGIIRRVEVGERDWAHPKMRTKIEKALKP